MSGAAAGVPAGRPWDDELMAHALALGRRGLGRTWPNPSVGAVLVQESGDGPVVVARARTADGGRPHAEPLALGNAGEAARGATLYVTLEPCSHHGRTPPCVEAVLAAGLSRVVSALEDPDPRVAGLGHALLRARGLAVTTDVCAAEARRDHAGHLSRVTRGRPHLLLKLAQTADGYAGVARGSLRITGEAAFRWTHLARARADAVMVGVGTVLADDPALTVRLPGLEARRPVRIVLDTAARTPCDRRLVRTARETPTWIVHAEDAPAERLGALRAAGAETIAVARGGSGRLDLRAALAALGQRGLTRLFCEGGPTLADALAETGLLDEVALLTSKLELGEPGTPALGPELTRALDELPFKIEETRSLGPDELRRCRRRIA